MRIGALSRVGAPMTRIPPTRGVVRAVLRQVGLAGALASGRFTDTMLDWFHVVLRDTDRMRNELNSTPPLIRRGTGKTSACCSTRELRGHVTRPVLFIWGADDPNGGEAIGRRFAEPFPDHDVHAAAAPPVTHPGSTSPSAAPRSRGVPAAASSPYAAARS